MEAPTILIASDIHLSETIWSQNYDVYGDSYFALSEIRRVAIDYGASSVIFAGDVFNTHQPTSTDVVEYRRFVDALHSKDIQFSFIEGQHDRSSRRNLAKSQAPSWCEVHPAANYVNGHVVQLCPDETAYLMDWAHADNLPFELAKIPEECNVLICHQAWKEFLPEKAKGDGSLEDLIPKHIHTVFTGDHHKHTNLILRNGNLRVFSPGATHLRQRAEPLRYGVYLYRNGELRSVGIRSRPIYRFPVMAEEDMLRMTELIASEVDETLPEYVKKPMFIIKYCEKTAEYVQRIMSNKEVHVVAEYISTEQLNDEKMLFEQTAKFDTGDIVLNALDFKTKHNETLSNMARLLWSARDPRRTIEEFVLATEKGDETCASSDQNSLTSDATKI